MRMRLNADGTTAIERGPPLPLHLQVEAGLRIVCWVSAAAFIVGLSLLLISLGRLVLRKRGGCLTDR
jgi:hypothetical protein